MKEHILQMLQDNPNIPVHLHPLIINVITPHIYIQGWDEHYLKAASKKLQKLSRIFTNQTKNMIKNLQNNEQGLLCILKLCSEDIVFPKIDKSKITEMTTLLNFLKKKYNDLLTDKLMVNKKYIQEKNEDGEIVYADDETGRYTEKDNLMSAFAYERYYPTAFSLKTHNAFKRLLMHMEEDVSAWSNYYETVYDKSCPINMHIKGKHLTRERRRPSIPFSYQLYDLMMEYYKQPHWAYITEITRIVFSEEVLNQDAFRKRIKSHNESNKED